MIKERFTQFVALWQAYLDAHYKANFPTLCKEGRYAEVTFTEGAKYWKLVVANGTSRSARGFVSKETGQIFKSASWAAPAKHARGTVMAEDFGMSCMNEYGPNYLR